MLFNQLQLVVSEMTIALTILHAEIKLALTLVLQMIHVLLMLYVG